MKAYRFYDFGTKNDFNFLNVFYKLYFIGLNRERRKKSTLPYQVKVK